MYGLDHQFLYSLQDMERFPRPDTHISLTSLKSTFSHSEASDVGRQMVRGGSVSMKWSNGVSPLTVWQDCFLISGSMINGSLG